MGPGKTTYRADIDGLRAVSVLCVCFFHAGFGAFSGGFVGVDVFFVISGYLITTIVLADVRAERFTISGFYERRIRRIIPALFTVVLACLAAGAVIFLPRDLEELGRSVFSVLGFVSNFFFYRATGYFESAAETKPLLHTWSLSIEEQFYLFYPLFVALFYRKWPSFLKKALALIWVASLFLASYYVARRSVSAFYLTPFRVWELITGALIAMTAAPKLRSPFLVNALPAGGLFMVVLSAVAFDHETPFPGIAALLPCVGAAIIIHSGRSSGSPSLVARLLSLAPIVWFGLISYSLYLWHWPLFAFVKYFLVRPLNIAEAVLVLLASLALAALSYRYVELPFRQRKWPTRKTVFRGAVGATAALGALALVFKLQEGFPGRFSPEAMGFANTPKYATDLKRCSHIDRSRRSIELICRLGDVPGDENGIVLIGDSHARMFVPGLERAANERRRPLFLAVKVGCLPLLGLEEIAVVGQRCSGFAEKVHEFIAKKQIRTVFMVGRWASHLEGSYGDEPVRSAHLCDMQSPNPCAEDGEIVLGRGLDRTIKALSGKGRNLFVISGVPEVKANVSRHLALKTAWGFDLDLRPYRSDHDKRHRRSNEILFRATRRHGAVLLRPDQILCDESRCEITQNGRALYHDDDHLSIAGGLFFETMFDSALDSKSRATASHR